VTISSLATAAGTLVLAVATFAAVRSGNRAARVAERAFRIGLRPVIMPSRFEDPGEKVGFMDGHWLKLEGGCGVAEHVDGNVYLAISLRDAGSGLAVLHGWFLVPEQDRRGGHVEPERFRRLTRDLYIPPGGTGFWQGVLRDASDPDFDWVAAAIDAGEQLTVDILYGDHEGGQLAITRILLVTREGGTQRVAGIARHWMLDQPDPR
jgi:hypothetical protein